MHTKRYERIRAYKTDAEEKAKKANGFSEKQTKAKKADIRYTINDNDLLPNGNKKESKKESGSFDAILREYTGDEETLSLLGEWLKEGAESEAGGHDGLCGSAEYRQA